MSVSGPRRPSVTSQLALPEEARATEQAVELLTRTLEERVAAVTARTLQPDPRDDLISRALAKLKDTNRERDGFKSQRDQQAQQIIDLTSQLKTSQERATAAKAQGEKTKQEKEEAQGLLRTVREAEEQSKQKIKDLERRLTEQKELYTAIFAKLTNSIKELPVAGLIPDEHKAPLAEQELQAWLDS